MCSSDLNTLGTLAALIALFAGFVPTLMDGGVAGQNTFILVGFLLLGMSYGQAGEGYIRISLTVPDDRLEEALKRLSAYARGEKVL